MSEIKNRSIIVSLVATLLCSMSLWTAEFPGGSEAAYLYWLCENATAPQLLLVAGTLESLGHLKEYKDKEGGNFFFAALRNSHEALLDFLISRNDCRQYGLEKLYNGDTLLHAACARSTLNQILKIIKVWPDMIFALSDDGATVFERSLENPDPRVFNFFMQLVEKPECKWLLKHKNKEGLTILHAACKKSTLAVIISLMAFYPDLIRVLDNKGNGVFHHLVYQTDSLTLKYFFSDPKFKTQIMHKNLAGATVAHQAVMVGSIAALDMVLELYPEFADAVAADQKTIVQTSIVRDDAAALSYFLADPKFLPLLQKRGSDGETIVHEACMRGTPEMVKILTRRFPEYNQLRDAKGRGLWEYAVLNKRTAVLDFLTQMGYVTDDSELQEAKVEFFIRFLKNKSYELMIPFLKRYGTSYLGKTLSNRVISACLTELALLNHILACDASLVQLGDASGKTLLHHALREKKLGFCLLLVKYNADLFAADSEGVSCASVAVKEGLPEVINAATQRKLVRKVISSMAPIKDSQLRHLLGADLFDFCT